MTTEEDTKPKPIRIGQVAQGMLDGSIHYLEGAMELASLRHGIGAYENDPDFLPFVAILSEINSLPTGVSFKHSTSDAPAPHAEEIQKSIEWAKEFSLTQCQSLADRFSV